MANPALTAKHFNACAHALKSGFDAALTHCPASAHRALQNIHNHTCEAVADQLADANAKFDRVRFLDACGWARV